MSEADTVILGQSAVPVLKRLFQTSLSDRLSTLLPDKTLMIIPDVSARAQRNVKISQQAEHGVIKDMLKVAALLGAATVLALLFQKAGLQDANIITLYILCVTLTAVLTSSPLAGIVSAAASVVIFNYLFTEPLFYFQVYDPGYMITFVIMFIAASRLVRRMSESDSYIDQNKDNEAHIVSQYALEYLRHKLIANAQVPLFAKLSLGANLRWQDRVGQYTDFSGNVNDYKPYALVDARLTWAAPRYKLYVEANNLLDKRYADYGHVEQPGRWLIAGFTIAL